MRIAEVRRHSIRGSGPNLSEAGRQLAAAVRTTMAARYDRVLASDKPRAVETAEIMGFVVDAQDAAFSVFDTSLVGDYAAAFHDASGRRLLQQHAQGFVEAIHGYLADLPDGSRLLLISHGGAMEQVAAQFAPDFSLEAIGGPFAPCEGFSLHFDEHHAVVALDLHRLSGLPPQRDTP